MNNILKYILILCLFTSCSPKVYTVYITNPSKFDRNEIAEISLSNIRSKISLSDSQQYLVKNALGDEIPSQLTYDAKLIFPSILKSGEKQKLTISVGEIKSYEAKVGGRFYPERKDDFAWENDRVGFRFYGHALQLADGPSNGLDLWYKRTDKLVLDEWYKKDIAKIASYHVDHGEGCDPYGVKRSLGAGAMAPFVGDILWQNNNHIKTEVLDNGPLRVTAKLTYPDIEVNGKSFEDVRIVSLDVGSQLTKIVQMFGTKEEITVAAGIVKRNTKDLVIFKESNYTIYEEPETKQNGKIFVGVLIPQGIDSVKINSFDYKNIYNKIESYSHVLSLTQYAPNKPITYYTGFGWTKFGFPNIESFKKYMKEYSERINNPLLIETK